jgi:bacteriorhodopsin
MTSPKLILISKCLRTIFYSLLTLFTVSLLGYLTLKKEAVCLSETFHAALGLQAKCGDAPDADT